MELEFKLTEKEKKRFDEWKINATKRALEFQKFKFKDCSIQHESVLQESWDLGYPYCGPIGGEYSFTFTPTSVGTLISVKNNITDEKKDITDLDSL